MFSKKNRTKQIIAYSSISLVLAISTIFGYSAILRLDKQSSLKKYAIAAAQKYVENEQVSVQEKITTPTELLAKKGYLEDFDQKCLQNSYVTVEDEDYTAHIDCSNKTADFLSIMPNGIIEGILKAEIVQTPTSMTSGNVQVTITASEPVSEVEGWTLIADGKQLIKVFAKNEKVDVLLHAVSNASKTVTVTVDVANIDKTAPKVKVNYSTTSLTKEDIIVTITSDKKLQDVAGWTLSSDQLVLTKTYTQNTNETVTIKDYVGNDATALVNITNIDKVAPVLNVSYNPTEKTNGDVTVTITSDKILRATSGWTLAEDKLSLTKVYSANTNTNVLVRDMALNEVEVPVIITNIDKTAPRLTVTYSTKGITKDNVLVTVKSNKELKEVTGWTLSLDKLSATKEYTTNTTENVEFEDALGNKGTANIAIANIDKEAPTVEVSYDMTEPTQNGVTVTIKSNEILRPSSGYTLSEDKLSMTRTYTSNINTEVVVRDMAMNEVAVAVVITNIDKTAPRLTVTYSSRGITKNNVIVTVKSNEVLKATTGWTLADDKLSATKEYEANATEEVIFSDFAGNETKASIAIANIDKKAPKAEVSYDIVESTNGTVTVTITSDEVLRAASGWTLSVDKLSMSKIYTRNTEADVLVRDMAMNTTTVHISIANIDNTAPRLTVSYSSRGATKNNVIVTIKSNEVLKAVEGWTLAEDKLSATKEYEANTTEEVTFSDLSGNESIANVTIANIDKQAPNTTVEYSTTDVTNGDVTVTIISDEILRAASGWTLAADKLSMTKVFTKNTELDVLVRDNVLNETTVHISIANIDKTGPKLTVTYSTKGTTKDNVLVTITSDKALQTLAGWTLADDKLTLTKEFTENTEVTVNPVDILGNQGTALVKITNIDKQAPIVSVEYSTKDFTNGNVVVTIKSNEILRGASGWTLSEDKLSLTKEFDKNIETDYIVRDMAMNETTVSVKIANIDKTGPKLTVTYSTKGTTKENVLVTITSDKMLQEVAGFTLSADKLTATKEYVENIAETVTFLDTAGNATSIKISINNIDKEAPKLEVSYSTTELTNGDVLVTITSNKIIRSVSNWTLSEDKLSISRIFSQNTEINVIVRDLAMNEASAFVSIKNIDKTAPVLNVSYNPTTMTNGNVIVTITSNKALKALAGWTLADDKLSATKEYTDNTKEEVTMTDIAGNEAKANVEITNIDRTAPVLNVTYNPTVPTRGNVIVTITSNKILKELNGWTLAEDKLSATKEYTENVTETVEFQDTLGNKVTANIEIANIDRVAPNLTVSYDPTVVTGGNVTVKVTSDKALQEKEGWTLASDKLSATKEYSENVTETVEFQDALGNKATISIEVTNIDKTAPVLNVKYSTTELTNQNVLVTITSNKQIEAVTGWTLSEDKLSATKEYSENSKETVEFQDGLGNKATASIEITNIDKTAPVLTVGYSTTDPTKENVLVTITSNKELKAQEGWTLSSDKKEMTKQYATNETATITVSDLAGNQQSIEVAITNIDKVAPTLTVEYSTTDLTNQNVLVTIRSNEKLKALVGWTLAEDKLSATKEYESNVDTTVVFQDLATNETSIGIKITNIDKVALNLTIAYTPNGLTNGNVLVTITSNKQLKEVEGWTLAEDKLSATKEYTENKEEKITFSDFAGNEAEANVTVTNIDRVAPKVTVGYSTSQVTNGDVLVTLTSDKKLQALEGWDLASDQMSMTKVFTSNSNSQLIVTDLAGNTTKVTVNVKNIDKEAPKVTVSYNPSVLTNGDVTVTITADERIRTVNGWVLSDDKLSISRIFSSNITTNIVIKDIALNETSLEVNVTNIDKVAPVLSVEYNTTNLTNQNVLVTVRSNKALQEKEGWTLALDKLSLTKEYASNVTEEVSFKDVAGNESNATVSIANIDKTAPVLDVEYSNKNLTNQNVLVTVKSNKELKVATGWTLASDKLSATKEYSANTMEDAIFYDLAGNEATASIEITNIDKTAPVLSVEYSTTNLTNQTVLVTVKSNKELQEKEGWTLSVDKLSATKEYSANANEEITFTDLAGNTASATVEIANIDKTAPVLDVEYSNTNLTNQNVTVTIKSNKELQAKEGWTLAEDKLSATKEYSANANEEVTFIDLAGNTASATVEIANIDKTAPVLDVEYSNTNLTNQTVLVTVKSNKELQEKEGWTLSVDKLSATKEYSANANEEVTFTDLAGNTASVTVAITNIDKTAPVLNVEYSTTELTNGNVIVTIKSNKELQALEGWTLSDDKLSLTKEYSANANEEVTFTDLAGNTASVTVTITNIDKTAPVLGVSYNPESLTNGSVIVTVTSNKMLQEKEGWTLSSDKLSATKEFADNISGTTEFQDLAGNTAEVRIDITNIDRTAPVLSVEYSTTNLTNQNVLVTVKSNKELQEKEGWTLSVDKLSATKEYSANANEEVTFTDLAGNAASTTVAITNIDKTAPVLSVEYSNTNLTNQNVIVTIKSNKELQVVEGWTLSDDKLSATKEYSANANEEVTFTDLAGNTASATVAIANIDRTAPVLSVEYSTTQLTNGNVLVTIKSNKELQEKEGWTLADDKLSATKEYSANANEEVTFTDLAGNTASVTVAITNIDKTAPVLETEYSNTNLTNQNVIVTIKSNKALQAKEGWTLSADKLSATKEYSANANEEVTFTDLAGNTASTTVAITNIDKTAPVLSVEYSNTNLTNQNVIVTIKSNKELQAKEGWTLADDKLSATKEYSVNTNEEVTFLDLAGNTASATVEINNIDRTAPVLEVEYSNTNLTNQNVTVTIKSNKELQALEGWTLSSDKLSATKEYSANANEEITFTDLAGNTASATVEIANIDRTAPVLEVEYSNTNLTNQNVTVTIKSNKELQALEGWTLSSDKLSATKEYSANANEEITFTDLAGNTASIAVEINNIDKTAPVLSVEYSNTNLTNQNVIVTIKSNKELQAVEGWTLSDDKLSATKEYSANANEEITFTDLAGNTASATVEINNIDKTAPVLEVEYSNTNLTNQNVTVTIKSNKALQEKEGWTLSEDKLSTTKEFTDNISGMVEIQDLAGNTAQIHIEISNIDKVAPALDIEYSNTNLTNQNVTVTIKSNKELQALAGWTLSDDKLSATKEYSANANEEVTFTDLAGNTASATVEINNIDKTAPVLETEYSNTNLTNQNVIVTIKSNKALQALEGWTLSDDKLSATKEYSTNANEEVTFTDLAGNTASVTVAITNIDKTAPVLETEYSNTNLTNQNVTVTIKSNKALQALEGWTLSEDKLSATKEYSANANEEVTFTDLAGNTASVTVEINNIDKTAPILETEYSNTNLTNQNVIVTVKSNKALQALEGWTLSEDKLSATKEYSANANEEVTFTDLAGNTVSVTVIISNIDKTAPVLNVEYSNTNLTNQNVTVTIKSNKELQALAGWTLSDDKLSATKEYSANANEEVTFTDLAGNTTSATVEIANIDRTAPVLEVEYSNTNLTNQNVTVTIKSSKALQSLEGWTLSSDKLSATKEYSANAKEEVTFTDLAGNTASLTVEINNIDKTAPVLEVEYSNTNLTNQNVTVTIKSNKELQEKEGWTLSSDKLSATKEYSANANEEVTFTDLAGNTASVTVAIANIDKTAPVLETEYSNTNLTNQNVIVTVKSNKELQSLEGWTLSSDKLSATKEYSANANEEVTFTDLAGNTASVTVAITNIDKTAPVLETEYSNTNLTNQNVIVTVKSNKELQALVGWTLSDDKLSATKEYSANANEEVTFTDLAGNTASATVAITNIDKTAPVLETEYSNTNLTNQNVIVTIKSNKELQALEGWTLSDDKLSATKEYSANANEEVTFTDLAGNTASVTVAIANIDKTAPTIEVAYDKTDLTNQDVTVTITSNEALQALEGFELSGDLLSMKRTYTANSKEDITITDLAGNTVLVTVEITNIDKVAPEVEVSYSTTEATKEDVTVTITSNKQLQALEGWTLALDKLSMTKVIGQNHSEVVSVKDLAGNSVIKSIIVNNIDKNAPVVEVTYDKTELTNQNVLVTITSNEILKELEGWTLSEDKLSLTKTYSLNAKEEVTVSDLVGNTSAVTVNVTNIDKTAPVIAVDYSKTDLTKDDVTVTITANKAMKALTGWELSGDMLSMTKTYTANTQEEITVTDLASNTASVTVTITNIDKTAPVVKVTYDKTELTNQSVLVTITSNEVMKEKEGWILSEDKLSLTKEYQNNTTEEVTISDLAGNESNVNISITNIDKTAPVVNVTYDKTDLTKDNVVVTITSNKALKEVEGWTLSLDKLSLSKTFEANTEEVITVSDLVGNQTEAHIHITNIDKTAPTATITYSPETDTKDNVLVTITSDEMIKAREGWELSGDMLSIRKEYTTNETEEITIQDLAGNETKVQVKVTNIDRTAPVVTGVENGKLYNKNVTIHFNEGTASLNGNMIDSDQVITADGTYRLVVKDAALNETVVTFIIDKTAPVITIYDEAGVAHTSNFTITKEYDKVNPFANLRAEAKDNHSSYVSVTKTGEVTLSKIGTYTLTYQSKDEASNTATVVVTVKVVDTKAPVLKLRGESLITVELGNQYVELGATATDDYDGATNVEINGTVNPSVIGTYTITYKTKDSSGNQTTITRTVKVIPKKVSSTYRLSNSCNSTGDCYNLVASNNYIWYSGYLWRVIKVNENNTVKLVTEDAPTGFSYANLNSSFSGSHAQDWLLNVFYPTLNKNSSIVVDGDYCNQSLNSLSQIRYTCDAASVVRSKAGLLTIDEYNILGGAQGFLNTGDIFYTMTPTGPRTLWTVQNDGSKTYTTTSLNTYGIRPVITINANTEIVSGSGSKNDPYRFVSDNSANAGDLLNTSKPGEYVSFAGQKWRVSSASGNTKLVMDSYFLENGNYAKPQYGTNPFNLSEGIGAYLNNTVYNTLFDNNAKQYLDLQNLYATSYAMGANPLTSSMSNNGTYYSAYVSALRVGDIYSGSSSTSIVKKFSSWLMNYEVNGSGWYTSDSGTTEYGPRTNIRGLKPVISLKSGVRIVSGNGTSQNPYVIAY